MHVPFADYTVYEYTDTVYTYCQYKYYYSTRTSTSTGQVARNRVSYVSYKLSCTSSNSNTATHQSLMSLVQNNQQHTTQHKYRYLYRYICAS